MSDNDNNNNNNTFSSFYVSAHSSSVFMAKVCYVVARPCLYAAGDTGMALLFAALIVIV